MTQNYANDEIRVKVEAQMEADRQKKEKRNRYLMYGAAAISVICAIVCVKKLSENRELMGIATRRINAMTSVDVPQEIIDNAVTNAANRQVSLAVQNSVDNVKDIINQETRRRVKQAVTDNYSRISESVVDSVKKEVVKISAEGLADEVRKAARKELISKLESKFDDVIEDVTDSYTKNLDNMNKLYESMARRAMNNT